MSSGKNKNARTEVVREYLLERNKNKQSLIDQFLQTQMYANYLDSLIEGIWRSLIEGEEMIRSYIFDIIIIF